MRIGFRFLTGDFMEKSKKGTRRSNHKYIRVFTGNNGKDEYIYPADMQNPFKKLLSIFAVTKERISKVFKDEDIESNYGVDENTFAAHILEYLSARSKWDKYFSEPVNSHVNKRPVNLNKKKGTEEKKTDEKKTEEKKEPKFTINRSLMRKVWAIFNPAKELEVELEYNARSVTRTVEPDRDYISEAARLTNEQLGIAMESMVNEVKRLNAANDSDGLAQANLWIQALNNEYSKRTEESEKNEAEETKNRSDAMLGNDNAKKDIYDEEERAEFNSLTKRYAELDKEFKANGGYSYKRTTKEQDEKRRAASKEKSEVTEKLRELKAKISERNKGKMTIPAAYKDVTNTWLKRLAKGDTISWEWLDKKFGGHYGEILSFGDGFYIDLSGSTITNPVVNIKYNEPGRGEHYVSVDVGEMNKDQYRPRFMNIWDSNVFSEVYATFESLKEKINNTEGNTPAEKFFNMVLGTDNEITQKTGNSNVPNYRFTKDGIKDKNGKLEKIRARINNEGTPDEIIDLMADGYSDHIPSIFFPENDTDTMTDYFDKDSAYVKPDHPYYNHLKVMALKNRLYRGRATKWGAMSKEDQDKLEKQIKELEKNLVEPTEQELKDYRERRDHEEEVKENWNNSKRNVARKEQEERERKAEEEKENKFADLIGKLADSLAKEPPVNLNGLTKDEQIDALENRIFKLDMEIKNSNDPEVIDSKTKFRNSLTKRLEQVRNEPETAAETTPEEPVTPVRPSAEIENELADVRRRMFTAEDDEFNTLRNRANELNEELNRAKESEAEAHANRSAAMMGNQNARKDGVENDDVAEKKQILEDLENQKGDVTVNQYELDKQIDRARSEVESAEIKAEDSDGIVTPIPTIDRNVANRVSDNSMSGRGGEVYQHDVNIEMKEFRDMFDTSKMNAQQKEYFQERLNSYAGLVGSSYNTMASKRLSAGPSWVVAGPAKYNFKRFEQKMNAEMRAYEDFKDKKDKFIKNTQKHLKELKYTGGAESEEEVRARVYEDYSNGHYGYGDKIDITDPYAIEKMSGKIKYMENAHEVTLMYGRECRKLGISTMNWNDTPEEQEKRKEAIALTRKAAQEKGITDNQIKQGIAHPFTQNQNQELARNKQRLEEMKARKAAIEVMNTVNSDGESENTSNPGRVDFDGGYIYENLEMDRIQIIYDEKPSREVIDKLKHSGFRWSPSQGAWQRQLNRNGRMAVNRIMSDTGKDVKIDIDGAGEVKKADMKEDEMFIKAFEFCDFYLGKSYGPGDIREWKGKTFIMNSKGKWERQ